MGCRRQRPRLSRLHPLAPGRQRRRKASELLHNQETHFQRSQPKCQRSNWKEAIGLDLVILRLEGDIEGGQYTIIEETDMLVLECVEEEDE